MATVGESPEPIINGFRLHRVDHQVLLHGPETLDVATTIKRRIEDFAGKEVCDLVEVDPYDMHDVIVKVLSVWKGFPNAEFHVNITGGTKVMASAALVACFAIGGAAYYVKGAFGEVKPSLASSIVDLPVPKVPLKSLGETQGKILKHLQKHEGRIKRANSSLQGLLRRPSAQLVSYHLKMLEKKGLIELTLEGRGKTATLTETGRLYAELI